MQKIDRYVLAVFMVLPLLSCQKEDAIPRVSIKTQQEIQIDSKTEAVFTVKEFDKNYSGEGKIKYRGGFSIGYPKKSYAVKLNKKASWAGLPTEDDWVLNASYADKTFLRHKLGYDLFRAMNINNIAPLCSYVEVYENDSYRGLYVLKQKLTPKIVGVNKADSSALLFKEPPIFYKDGLHFQDSVNLFQQKWPKLKYRDRSDVMYAFKDFLEWSDEEAFYDKIVEWLDLDNIIDWYVLILFANAGDNIVKNFYLYKKDFATPFRVAMWDFDHCFGRDGDNEYNMMDQPLNIGASQLFIRLRNNPYLHFNAKVEQRWQELRDKQIIDYSSVNQRIMRETERIYPYIYRNQSVWAYYSKDYYDANTFEEEIKIIQQFIELRIRQLNELFCYQ